MMKQQFGVLYREFLFRMVDLELLSSHAQGDMSRLFGQFASLLIFLSLLFTAPALGMSGSRAAAMAASFEHFLIATTMLVVGLFAVLSWDATFPDRRDVLVLAPLPVRARTIFLAKVAGVAASLGLTVLVLHSVTGLVWPLALNPGGFGGLIRSYAAYWASMLAAGAFIFCCVLGLQGLAAELLPRRHFLRASSWMQLASFCLLVTVYFLEPPRAAWSPATWFVGFFEQLNGSPAPAPLAHRAWIGLGTAAGVAAVAYALSYFRMLRRIVEEQDIAPAVRGTSWLPRFGSEPVTAVVHFSVRTLLRSRHHRMILAFYLGIAFALTITFLKTPAARQQLGGTQAPLLTASLIALGFWVVGTRVVFSMPSDLRANWTFRLAAAGNGLECAASRRRSLLFLAAAPVWAGSTALMLWSWPWAAAVGHIVVLGFLGAILVEMCLYGQQKIPFTCAYLPGRSNFHLTFWLCIGLLMQIVSRAAMLELWALENPRRYAAMLAVLVVLLAALRLRSYAGDVQFEETPPGELLALGLSPGPVTSYSTQR